MKFCQKCGKEISETAAVCIHCGEAIKTAESVNTVIKNNPGKGFGIASMILGICSLCIPYVGILGAIVGLILGVIGKKKSLEAGMPSGMATAGIVMSIIALAWSIVCVIYCVVCYGAAVSSVGLWDW